MSYKYDIGKTIRKGIASGIKTAVLADAAILTQTDPESIKAHVAALISGAVAGFIRGVINWYKNK